MHIAQSTCEAYRKRSWRRLRHLFDVSTEIVQSFDFRKASGFSNECFLLVPTWKKLSQNYSTIECRYLIRLNFEIFIWNAIDEFAQNLP